MATVPSVSPSNDGSVRARSPLTVSSYERTATIVIALLVVFGTLAIALAMVFFANKFESTVEPIAFVPVEASSPSGSGGVSDDPEPPGVEDAPELSEPGLADTLAAVASTTASLSDAIISDQTIKGTADQAGRGSGLGDARQPGPGGDGVIERVPRWERWKIRFEPQSAGEFNEWLDQHKIRVGVLGRDNKVYLAWNFTGARETEVADPKGVYDGWGRTLPADGPMPALTAALARDAGIMQRGPIALLFCPPEVEALLYTLEMEKNTTRDPNKIRETIFTVIRGANGLEFSVSQIKYF